VADLTGPQKAAIAILSLGEKFAAEIFKRLDEEEVKELGRQMSLIRNVPQEQVEAILNEFNQRLGTDMDLVVKGDEFVERALTTAIGKEAGVLLEEMNTEAPFEPFKNVKDVDSRVLANFIKNEHPQTIAVILAHLDSAKGAEVLREFSENLQYEVLLRIAMLDTVPPGVIQEIDAVLEEEVMSAVDIHTGGAVGGVAAVAELLNQVDKSTEEAMLERLEEYKSELADEVRQLMFVFEDLIKIDDRGIRAILREVSNEDLTVALKTASEEMKSKILNNVSERAAAMIVEDLEVMGPVRLSDVEQAQQAITRVARRLEKEGKVVISGKGGEDEFV